MLSYDLQILVVNNQNTREPNDLDIAMQRYRSGIKFIYSVGLCNCRAFGVLLYNMRDTLHDRSFVSVMNTSAPHALRPVRYDPPSVARHQLAAFSSNRCS